MKTKNITLITVLYKPKVIFEENYIQLIEFGYSMEIWCNSFIEDKNLISVNKIESKGAVVYKHFQNYGLGKIFNSYLKKKTNSIIFFLDQDTKINPNLFNVFINKNWKLLNSNFLVYGYNKIKPKFFFTNSGSFFNLNRANLLIPDIFFVELIDYFIFFKILENKLKYNFIEVDFLDHYGFQNNLNINTGKKKYDVIRKKEILASSLKLCKLIFYSSELNFKNKIKLFYHTILNAIKIIL